MLEREFLLLFAVIAVWSAYSTAHACIWARGTTSVSMPMIVPVIITVAAVITTSQSNQRNTGQKAVKVSHFRSPLTLVSDV